MPWCEECSRWWPAEAVTAAGGCPTCERVIGDVPRAPWHFKLLVIAVVLYLGWRAWQGIVWVAGRL